MNKNEKLVSEISDFPILIYDQVGQLGNQLAAKFALENLCIIVSSNVKEKSKNIISIPFKKRIPAIPKCKYKAFYLIFNGDKMLLDLLSAFVEKAKEDKIHIYFLLNIRDASEELIKKVKETSSIITVVLIGDIFSNIFNWQNPVTSLLEQSRQGKIVLKNDGLKKVFPVFDEDVFRVLDKILKLKGISGHRVLYFLPPHPVTELSFTRAVLKHEPLIKVDITSEKVKDESYIPKVYASVFGVNYSYSKKLPAIEIIPVKKITKKIKKKRKIIKPPLKRLLTPFLFILILFILGLPIITAIMGTGYLARAQTHLRKNDFTKAKTSALAAKSFFNFTQRSSTHFSLFKYLGLRKPVESFQTGVSTGKTIAELFTLGLDGLVSLKKVFHGESNSPKKDFINGTYNIKYALVQLSTLKAEGKIPKAYLPYLKKIEKLQSMVVSLSDVLPHLAGIEKEKKYLVLFQNNMELRPGGGFIGSYGILKIKEGRIIDFPIHDVYDADGQLKEHIEPPFQLRRYLGSNHWFLRDSNFDIDFPKNGAAAAFFLNAETGEEVDGVISIDTTVIKYLLSAIGPLKVVGYNETVNANNFFLLTEKYAQDEFFPGSRQKQNFLKAVSVSLFARLFETEEIPYLAVANALADSISQKHMLFAFPDKSIQNVFSLNGMSASLEDLRKNEDGIVNDFVGVSEANLGQNKVNYYLDRAFKHKVQFASINEIAEELTLTYHNKSNSTSKYGGNYKTYIRFILPINAVLNKVSIDGAVQDAIPAVIEPQVFTALGYQPPSGLEIEKTQAYGKTIYGFLLNVPQLSKRTVSISYTVPVEGNNSVLKYSLRVFKQPGTGADPYYFTFKNLDNFKILKATDALKVNSSGASILTTLAEDREIEIELGRK